MTSDTEISRILKDFDLRGRRPTTIGWFGLLLVIVLTAAACTSQLNNVEPTGAEPAAEAFETDSEEDEPSTEPDTESELDAPVESVSEEVGPTSPGLEIDVDRVSDGDSVRASSDEGDLEIRLLGINAPEQDECFGDRAGQILEELLDAETVLLHPWPAELDDFGRELGFLVADGSFVNLALIERGAVVARAQADHGFVREFESAETSAAEAGVGLWASDACGTPTDAAIEIVDAEADAPGNDQENPNGEWIEIQNRGEQSALLEGWSVRDESTRHRYDLPTVSLDPGQRVRIFTGCGTDDLNGDPGSLFWCSPEPPVWNNGGDTAFLLDPNGGIADTLGVGG